MQAKQIIAALAALGCSAKAAVLPRQVEISEPATNPAGCFQISSFSVAAEPHASETSYSLELVDPSTSNSSVSTTCSTTTPTAPSIGTFANLPCDNSSVTWSFSNNGTGYLLELKHNWGMQVQHAIVVAYDNVTDSATAFFPESDVQSNPAESEGSVSYYLNAPSAFDVEYSRYFA